MKIITINSKKYGTKEVLVDDEDFEYINNFKWVLSKIQYQFYAKRREKTTYIYLHRQLMGFPKNMLIDHKDGNGLNNQKSNLRICTKSQNMMNVPARPRGTCLYKGVSISNKTNLTKRYVAYINSNYKRINLGYFKTEIEAAKAYDKKAIEIHGEFANLNFK